MFRYNCVIRRVVDGDTVDVDIDLGFGIWQHKERVRIHGIDTPESRTRDKIEKQFGLLAKKFVEGRLPVGSNAILVTEKAGDDSKGKFGRILGKFEVYDHETDSTMFLGDIMIREGHAVPYFGMSKDDLKEAHLANRQKLHERGEI
jgi:micrococcal nuclease